MKKFILSIFALSLFIVIASPVLATDSFDLSEVQSKLIGEATSDQAGYSVSSAGDVNNDGINDILIGAINEDSGGSGAGAVYLFYGPIDYSSGISLSSADVKITGENYNDYAGCSVSSAGDVNNDGINDILIGATGEDSGGSGAGAVYLIYGSTGLSDISLAEADVKFTGEAAGDQAGYSVSSAGDVNNDGINDILIGAINEDSGGSGAGAVYLFYGPIDYSSGISLSSADVKITGENYNDYAGCSVSSAGDVNNDGINDILIGAYYANDIGAVYLIYGSAALASDISLADADVKFSGDSGNRYAGFSVSSAGDVNNDGINDILIGADGYYFGAGAVYLIYGSSILSNISIADADVKFTGEAIYDRVGYSVSSAGDVNNDGINDILIGADGYYFGAGAVYLIYGSSILSNISIADADVKFTGEAAGDQAGYSVSSAGDVNNDGINDILIGANGYYFGAGAVYLSYLYIDDDGDGVTGSDGLLTGIDCNDSDATITANQTYYIDSDSDGIGGTTTTSVCSYTVPEGYVSNSGDCNDSDTTVYEEQTYYLDNDGDGLGDPEHFTQVCSATAPEGYVSNSDDDDDNPAEDPTEDPAPDEPGDNPEEDETLVFDQVDGLKNGKIKVYYDNGTSQTYTVFNKTTSKTTRIKQYSGTDYLVVLQANGKRLALVNSLTGEVLDKKKLAYKLKQKYYGLKIFTLRDKTWAVVTVKNKKKTVRLHLVKIKINQEEFSTKITEKIDNLKIKPSKTKQTNNYIKLRNKSGTVKAKYLLTKKFNLSRKK